MSKTGFAKDHLNSFIQRIERLEEEKSALAADIREVYSEAKGCGFDPKIMRKVIALRKMDAADRQEMEAILDLYKSALGMLSDTPLGEAAMRAASPHKNKQPPHDPETGEIIEHLEVAPQGTSEIVTGGEKPAQVSTPVAQWLEPSAHNGLAAGSNPAGRTNGDMEIPAFLRRTKPPPELVE